MAGLALAFGLFVEDTAQAASPAGRDLAHGHSLGWIWSDRMPRLVAPLVDSVWALARAKSKWFGRSGAYYRFC